MEKIRLNEQKRRLLKKEWSHTVYNNMPMHYTTSGTPLPNGRYEDT
jgi:hypothetical protein